MLRLLSFLICFILSTITATDDPNAPASTSKTFGTAQCPYGSRWVGSSEYCIDGSMWFCRLPYMKTGALVEKCAHGCHITPGYADHCTRRTRRMPEWAGRQMEAISHRGSRERDYGKHDRFGRSPRRGSSTRRRGNSRDPSEVGKVGQRAARAVEVRKFDRVHAYIPPPPLLIDPRAYPYQPRPHLPWEEEAWGRAPGSD